MGYKKKILIIEDELDFANLLTMRLTASEYDVTIAVDAYQGTQACIKKQFDLIVRDLQMPAGGGFSVLERIRKIPSKMTVPVIILTELEHDEEIQKLASQYKVISIYRKPYDPKQFLARIKEILSLA